LLDRMAHVQWKYDVFPIVSDSSPPPPSPSPSPKERELLD